MMKLVIIISCIKNWSVTWLGRLPVL